MLAVRLRRALPLDLICPMTVLLPPTLDTCAQEPIHLPGAIQPQGALMAMDRLGRITHLSANFNALLGVHVELGSLLRQDSLGAADASRQLVRVLIDALGSRRPARSLQSHVGSVPCDVVLHRADDRLVVECEPRTASGDAADFAQYAFRSLQELKTCGSVAELLEVAVGAVRELTGFDRVMAYRFSQDDSGEVVAEARDEALDAYVGRRYPASDIPAQARRLYLINTLRLIADVAYTPVPIMSAPTELQPLDLSHSVLRSVSPIHVEYLSNMGVHGSMSASIVVAGRLWGMLACHHQSAMMVPYPIRMAVDVMAQVIAATVQSLIAQRREAAIARAGLLCTGIVSAISGGADVVDIVQREHDGVMAMLHADALVALEGGKIRVSDTVDMRWLTALARWLSQQAANVVHVTQAVQLPDWPSDVEADRRFVGVLALRFDASRQGWIVALRRERVHTIRWGGKPDKVIAHGPLGPRLTPRGSFDEWRETVRGTSSAWSALQLEIASQFLDAVSRVHADRLMELDRLRSQLWAILGHDLRNPLQSINMANAGIAKGHDPGRLNSVIRNSTRRMNRLLLDVLDVSRLQQGMALTIVPEALDLVVLVQQLVDEALTAQPSSPIHLDLPPALPLRADPGRLAQLISNLLSNARHHGTGDTRLSAAAIGDTVRLQVSNAGEPIPERLLPTLFDPFKRTSAENLRNRTGMGLGLYIAAQVAAGHGGTLAYLPGANTVTFEVLLPRTGPHAVAD